MEELWRGKKNLGVVVLLLWRFEVMMWKLSGSEDDAMDVCWV